MISKKQTAKEVGLTLIRVTAGLLIAHNGLPFFNSGNMHEFGNYLAREHFPLPHFMGYLAKGTEFFGGILFAAGLLTKWISIPLIFVMLVIIALSGRWTIFGQDLPVLYILVFAIFGIDGAGKFSIDRYIARRRSVA